MAPGSAGPPCVPTTPPHTVWPRRQRTVISPVIPDGGVPFPWRGEGAHAPAAPVARYSVLGASLRATAMSGRPSSFTSPMAMPYTAP